MYRNILNDDENGDDVLEEDDSDEDVVYGQDDSDSDEAEEVYYINRFGSVLIWDFLRSLILSSPVKNSCNLIIIGRGRGKR